MKTLKEVFFPKSVEEILDLKDKYGENAVFIAGSTSLGLRRYPPKPFMIDLNQAGISFIKEERNRFRIGAAITVNRLMTDKRLNHVYKNLFYNACKNLSSCTLRNMITVGGNVCFSLPWSDLPPVFIALGAKFVLKNKRGERLLSSEDFFRKHPSLIIENNEVLLQILIDKPKDHQRFYFHKYSLTENDYAIVTLAINFNMAENDKIRDFRSALGGMYNPAIRLNKIDNFLVGKSVHKNHDNRLTDLLNLLPTPIKDTRFSQEYRKKMASNLFVEMVKSLGPNKC